MNGVEVDVINGKYERLIFCARGRITPVAFEREVVSTNQ
jgi:hypothetical protein